MSGKRVILHLGAPKTGTTSIQHGCIYRQKDLQHLGIIYPKVLLGTANEYVPAPVGAETVDGSKVEIEEVGDAHGTLFLPYDMRPPPTDLHQPASEKASQAWTLILSEFRDSDAKVLLVSAERLFFTSHRYDLPAVAKLFNGLDITLTIGMRNPAELFNALYATSIAGPARLSRPVRDWALISSYLAYGFSGYIDRLAQGLGIDDVRPFFAEDLWHGPRSILGAFLEHVGCETNIEQDFHSRPSPMPEQTLFLRRLNRRGLDSAAFFEILQAIRATPSMRSDARRFSLLPEPMQQRLDKRFRFDIDEIAQHRNLKPREHPKFSARPTLFENSPETDRKIGRELMPSLQPETCAALESLLRRL